MDAIKALEKEKEIQEQQAMSELKKQEADIENQKAQMLKDAQAIADSQKIEENNDTNLSEDELQALGDSLAGNEIVEEGLDDLKNLDETRAEVKKLQEEANKKVKDVTELTIDEVKKQLEDAYKKQLEAMEKQTKEKEEAFNKKMEEMKMAQMTEKDRAEYLKLQMAKEEADKMSKMAGLVEQLKQERATQAEKIREMQEKAKNIAYIRTMLKKEPWMADVVASLKIETEEGYKQASVLSERIKKWKTLEKNDISKGNKNAFGEVIGEMSDSTKKKADNIQAEMDNLLETIIRK